MGLFLKQKNRFKILGNNSALSDLTNCLSNHTVLPSSSILFAPAIRLAEPQGETDASAAPRLAAGSGAW